MTAVPLKQTSFNAGEEGTLNVSSKEKLTAEEAEDIRLQKKSVYVLVAATFQDKYGDGTSEYCAVYESPDWGEDLGCHGHRR